MEKIHYLIPLFLILTFFGPGYQTISIFVWIWFPLSVYYCRTVSIRWFIPFYFTNSFGTALAFLGTLNTNDSNWLPEYFLLSVALGFGMNILSCISLVCDRFAQNVFKGWPRYIFMGNNEMIQFTSFAGLGGLNFILSWGGTIGAYIIKSWMSSNFDKDHDTIPYQLILESVNDVSSISRNDNNVPMLGNEVEIMENNEVNSTQQNRKFRNIKIIKLVNPVMIYFIVIFWVIVYGSFRYSTTYIPFYQQNIESYAAHSLVKVGCVIGANNNYETKYYVNRTEELARNGTKFILWSEAAAIVTNTAEYNELEKGIKTISQMYKTYIGFTYGDVSSSNRKIYNKLTVMSPNGDILINYAKSNLVPFVEDEVTAGPKILQTNVTSDFGTIGGAICFDYNFPSFISQASKDNVDFMIQPSDTWVSPNAGYHFRTNTIRSIENGFTLFRCSHYGFSGAWGPYGQTYVAVETVDDLIVSFQIPLHKRVKTIYGVFGESWAWICLAFSILFCIIIIALILSPNHIKRSIKKLFP
ncbi:carbon-nitrogen hydrolase [Gigaspora margarita]|uniref:Carbon-nitrogen hydrolase n=1 Tax=Gigaspora margarita TaxID=4874 RepID=A0A8H4ASU2_GIGMA|nr:carbon-nitrogen hydrolase [Gigaspora margarita]